MHILICYNDYRYAVSWLKPYRDYIDPRNPMSTSFSPSGEQWAHPGRQSPTSFPTTQPLAMDTKTAVETYNGQCNNFTKFYVKSSFFKTIWKVLQSQYFYHLPKLGWNRPSTNGFWCIVCHFPPKQHTPVPKLRVTSDRTRQTSVESQTQSRSKCSINTKSNQTHIKCT